MKMSGSFLRAIAVAVPLVVALALGFAQQPMMERASAAGHALSVPSAFFLDRTIGQWCIFGIVVAGIGGLCTRRGETLGHPTTYYF